MNRNSKVANKSSEVYKYKEPNSKISFKLKNIIKLICELEGFSVNVRKVNKKEREFLKSQGEPVDEGIIYAIEKEKMAS